MGMSQTEFGRLAGGYPQGTVYNWESRGNGIPNKALVELKKHGVDTDWLLCGDVDRPSSTHTEIVEIGKELQFWLDRLQDLRTGLKKIELDTVRGAIPLKHFKDIVLASLI